jgi:hypothetical protein
MSTENKTKIKVSRQMSDKVYDKIIGCQVIGWLCCIAGALCLLIGAVNNEMGIDNGITTMIVGCVGLGNAITFSFLTGHFKALYPITKSAENQVAIDNEKYEIVTSTAIDIKYN